MRAQPRTRLPGDPPSGRRGRPFTAAGVGSRGRPAWGATAIPHPYCRSRPKAWDEPSGADIFASGHRVPAGAACRNGDRRQHRIRLHHEPIATRDGDARRGSGYAWFILERTRHPRLRALVACPKYDRFHSRCRGESGAKPHDPSHVFGKRSGARAPEEEQQDAWRPQYTRPVSLRAADVRQPGASSAIAAAIATTATTARWWARRDSNPGPTD